VLLTFAAVSESTALGRCLTDAQLSELRDAAPGHAPADLARHLAGCERCQARALFGAPRGAGRKKPAPEMPSLKRAVFMAALVLVAMAFFLWSLAKLTGRIQ
jgi:hypothetical protein